VRQKTEVKIGGEMALERTKGERKKNLELHGRKERGLVGSVMKQSNIEVRKNGSQLVRKKDGGGLGGTLLHDEGQRPTLSRYAKQTTKLTHTKRPTGKVPRMCKKEQKKRAGKHSVRPQWSPRKGNTSGTILRRAEESNRV